MARPVALRYGGESASVPGSLCVTVQAPFTACSPWYYHSPVGGCCSGKTIAVSRAVYLGMSIALEKNSRQRFLCGETSTAPEQRRLEAVVFFCFFVISELLIAAASCQI